MNKKLVKDVFYIDELFLIDCAKKEVKGDYFKVSLKFYEEVKNKEVSQLSKSQQSWLYNLSNTLQQKMKRQLQSYNVSNEKPKFDKKFAWLPKKTKKGWIWFSFYYKKRN